jgi:acetyl esterase/lipase
MSEKTARSKTFGSDFRLRGIFVASIPMALLVLVILYCVLNFVGIDGHRRHGLLALVAVPQFTIIAALLIIFGRHSGIKLATRAFGVGIVLTAIIALWPVIAEWRRAKEYNVSPSIGSIVTSKLNGGGPQIDKTITFGTALDGSALVLDVWRAQGVPDGKLRPAIVKVHGGSWIGGSRSGQQEWNKLFNDLGYDVFDVDYRTPPPVRWLDEIGDVKCAIGWVVTNASKYQLDIQRISTMGPSAGGNLALLAGYSMGDPRLPSSCHSMDVKIKSVINLYGPTELTLLYRTTINRSDLPHAMDAYIGGPPSEFPDRYKILSPVSHINKHSPPTITLQGETDRIVPVDQAIVLAEALAAAGVDHETYLFPWANHGFDVNWGSIATQVARTKVTGFLRKHG